MMIPPFAVPTGRSMFGDCWYQRIPTTKSKIWNLRLRFQFPPKTSLPYGSKSRLLRRYKLDTPRSVATRYVDSKRIRADPLGRIQGTGEVPLQFVGKKKPATPTHLRDIPSTYTGGTRQCCTNLRERWVTSCRGIWSGTGLGLDLPAGKKIYNHITVSSQTYIYVYIYTYNTFA